MGNVKLAAEPKGSGSIGELVAMVGEFARGNAGIAVAFGEVSTIESGSERTDTLEREWGDGDETRNEVRDAGSEAHGEAEEDAAGEVKNEANNEATGDDTGFTGEGEAVSGGREEVSAWKN